MGRAGAVAQQDGGAGAAAQTVTEQGGRAGVGAGIAGVLILLVASLLADEAVLGDHVDHLAALVGGFGVEATLLWAEGGGGAILEDDKGNRRISLG